MRIKQEEEEMAERAIESISTAIDEAVSPAVVEQEVSYNKFGTMVSRLLRLQCLIYHLPLSIKELQVLWAQP